MRDVTAISHAYLLLLQRHIDIPAMGVTRATPNLVHDVLRLLR